MNCAIFDNELNFNEDVVFENNKKKTTKTVLPHFMSHLKGNNNFKCDNIHNHTKKLFDE